uniref:Putative gpi-glcnac transferase complex n=2 Tax=Anopheles triannulatus TaxID=58253 RepID=A0A2M4AYE3_9DIPT
MGVFWTSAGKQIQVKLVHKSANVLHLSVENTRADEERRRMLSCVLGTLFCFAICALLFRLSTAHAVFLLPTFFFGYLYSNVIKSEQLVLVKDFALQCSTAYANGTVRNSLIPIEYIQDIIINEVFYNLKVVFVLQVLTKGNLFRRKPIITLLQHLKPGLSCLKLVFEEIHSVLEIEDC